MAVSTISQAGLDASIALTSPALTSPTISGTPVMGASVITSGTVVASTSGTSITFSSIPNWVKRVTVMFNGVSLSGTANYLIQVGSGSTSTTGYVSVAAYLPNGVVPNATSSTSGLILTAGLAASSIVCGTAILTLLSSSTNNWTGMCNLARADAVCFTASGVLPALSGALDRVVITTTNGTDTFDAGSINILYE